MASSLRGLHIVVTRPKRQAQDLCVQLEELGAEVISFPVLGIEPLDTSRLLKSMSRQSTAFDLAIFISPNAVEFGLSPLQSESLIGSHSAIAAVGKGSARALQERGIAVDVIPEQRFDSESLLAMPRLHSVAGQHIAIVKGEGGRDLLADTLRQRAAVVTEIPCYCRIKPDSDPKVLQQSWQNQGLDLIIVTSNEGLENLVEMVGVESRSDLFKTQLVVLSQRAVALATTLGFLHTPLVAVQASDSGLIETVQSWWNTQVGKG